MKLTLEQLHSVMALRGNRDFSVIAEAIAEHCSSLNERLIKLPAGDEYLRGQVAGFSTLLEALNDASKNIERALQPKS